MLNMHLAALLTSLINSNNLSIEFSDFHIHCLVVLSHDTSLPLFLTLVHVIYLSYSLQLLRPLFNTETIGP